MANRNRKQPEEIPQKTVREISAEEIDFRGTVRTPERKTQPKITGTADGKAYRGIPAKKGYNIYEEAPFAEPFSGDLSAADMQDML